MATIYSIPSTAIEFHYTRSSGPGGQHVNTSNTKVVGRLNIENASWLHESVRDVLLQRYSKKMNKRGELIVAVQDSRDQNANKK